MNKLEVLTLLRRQYHDLLNHIQVIMGYLEMQMSDQAMNYLKQVSSEIELENRISHIANADTALFLFRLYFAAQDRGLTLRPGDIVNLEVEEPVWENSMALLVNAFDEIAAACSHTDETVTTLDIGVDADQIKYTVHPPGVSGLAAREIAVSR